MPSQNIAFDEEYKRAGTFSVYTEYSGVYEVTLVGRCQGKKVVGTEGFGIYKSMASRVSGSYCKYEACLPEEDYITKVAPLSIIKSTIDKEYKNSSFLSFYSSSWSNYYKDYSGTADKLYTTSYLEQAGIGGSIEGTSPTGTVPNTYVGKNGNNGDANTLTFNKPKLTGGEPVYEGYREGQSSDGFNTDNNVATGYVRVKYLRSN